MITIVLLSACKKESSSQQSITVPPVSYIKNISIADTNGLIILQNIHYYDSLHRLIKISEQHYGNQDTVPFTYILNYSAARVTLEEFIDTFSFYSMKITYNLNSSGLVESSSTVQYASLTDSSILTTDTYQYNSDGYLISQVTTAPGGEPGTVSYHYSNLNVDYLTLSPTSSDSKQLFFYDISHFNSINNVNGGIQFLGKSGYNPVITMRMESPATLLITYSYTYDQMSRINRMSLNGTFGLPTLSWIIVPIVSSHQVITYTYY
jgi:hypothetical protein